MENSSKGKSAKSDITLRIINVDERSNKESETPVPDNKLINFLELSDKLGKFSFNIFKIIIVISIIVFIFSLAGWVLDKNSGVLIQSFKVSGMDNVSGESIADLLNCNIDEITTLEFFGQETASNKLLQNSQISLSKDERGVPSQYNLNLAVGDESFEKSLLGIGNVGVEGTSFSLGNLVLSMKRLVGREPNYISGSFQKYDSTISLIAILEDHTTDTVEAWEVKRNLSNCNQSIESLIPDMINDLAFQFVYKQCRMGETSERAYPKTWEAFKSLINSRKEYSRYEYTNNELYLNKSVSLVASIRQQEPQSVAEKELELLSDLSLALIGQNRSKDAEILYRNLSEIKPLESNINLGLIYGRTGDYEAALRYFNNSTQIDPMSFGAWFYKGVTHENMGQHGSAIKSYKKAIDIDSKSKRAWNNLGWNLHLVHNNSAAISAFEKAIEIDISFALARDNKGLVHKDEHDYSLATNEFWLAIKYDPNFSSPWNHLGEIHYQKGEYEDALKSYDKAISLNPWYAIPWTNKGLTFEKLNLQYEALEAYNRAILLSPGRTAPLIYKGIYLNKIGLKREAFESFKDALNVLEKSPHGPQSFYDKGSIYYQLNEYNKSLMFFNKAIELNPKWIYPWIEKGNVLQKLGRMDEALNAYEKVIELDPKWAAPRNNKGDALQKLGRKDEALNAYGKATELDPRLAVPWYNKGNVLRDQGKMDEAIDAYEKAIELDPGWAAPRNNKGNIISDKEKMGKALNVSDTTTKL